MLPGKSETNKKVKYFQEIFRLTDTINKIELSYIKQKITQFGQQRFKLSYANQVDFLLSGH